ncbi:MAG: hypothetical protein A2Y33_14945 [Spirochaetes bacterium GWF1_51_8]|nr:MAG: hypothetical protein A2Y33_14945 [Spirochaetes bacterium GWF1_51_8]
MTDAKLNNALLDRAEKGDIKEMEVLLSKGADLYHRDYDGRNALFYAVMGNQVPTLEFLIKKGISLESCDIDGETVLICAARLNNKDCVERLIEAGAKINAVDGCAKSALFYAIDNEDINSISFLIQKGADLELSDNHRNKAIDYAKKTNNQSILNLFINETKDKTKTVELSENLHSNLLFPFVNEVQTVTSDDNSIVGQNNDINFIPTEEDFKNAFTEKDVISEEENSDSKDKKRKGLYFTRKGILGFSIFISILNFIFLFILFVKQMLSPVVFYSALLEMFLTIVGGLGVFYRKDWGRMLIMIIWGGGIVIKVIDSIQTGNLKGWGLSSFMILIVIFLLQNKVSDID